MHDDRQRAVVICCVFPVHGCILHISFDASAAHAPALLSAPAFKPSLPRPFIAYSSQIGSDMP